MDAALFYILAIIAIAWLYDFYNGANDAANAVATAVSTRIIAPLPALVSAALLNGAGAFISTRVAKTIGRGLVDPHLLVGDVLLAALIGAVTWTIISTYLGMPISVTHALVGGIIGAIAVPYHWQVLNLAGLQKILLGMILSPVLGMISAGWLLQVLYRLSHRLSAVTGQRLFSRLQLVSAAWMSLSHGMNDTQNAMGIITVVLFTTGRIQQFEVPLWVIAGSGFFMSLGTYWGGWKVIRTIGMRIARIKPIHGFAAESMAGAVISGATYLGIPISTTHAITGAVLGAGAMDKPRAVRWHVMRDIVLTWIYTMPGAAIMAGLIYSLLRLRLW